MAQRILRPLDYGGLLDEAFDLYKSNFMLFAGIAGLVYLPLYAVFYSAGTAGVALSGIFGWVLSYLVIGATTWAVSQTYLNRETTIMESYRAVKGRFVPLIITIILSTLVVIGGFILLIIPGIIFALWYAFVSEVVVLEGKSQGAAMKRSKELAQGDMMRVFVFSILVGLLMVVANSVLTFPATAIFGQFNFFHGLAMGIAQALVSPFWVIVFVLLYYDMRVRKEGFDLEILAASIDQTQVITPQETFTK